MDYSSTMGITVPTVARHRGTRGCSDLHTFELPSRDDTKIEKSITVRLADNNGERSSANMLISRKYSSRGYGVNHKLPSVPTCVTFTASSGGGLIGTLSLTVDSPAGLACDKTFKEELDQFRARPGARLCELTKFAFDTSNPSLELLASLFHIIFIYGTHHYDCTDLFIEVNPRHRRFYQAMLGFKPVGGMRTNDAVAAPSHLMWLRVSEIRRYIDEHTGPEATCTRSLYRYFFSRKEEVGIYSRLASEVREPMPVAGKARKTAVAALASRMKRAERRHEEAVKAQVPAIA